ncbi:hypothetical protein GALMADRAFT_249189 [Galerina marginata CBS 339.88]|uniref:DNA ligase n=1 Tax=Galerina marginata (strain CBS 339.88) TaxID=685588 RepID=A0A067T5K5_GALM3|nr:hypothetical protein GALMADRAFT_249189 [Galerina marginata CBS 339.88]
MSKRTSSLTPSPTKKKPKLQHNQPQLDHFFSSPKTKVKPVSTAGATPPEFVQGNSIRRSNLGHLNATLSKGTQIVDVDALDLEEQVKPSPEPLSTGGSVKNQVSNISILGKVSPIDPLEFLPFDVDPILYDHELPASHIAQAPYSLLTHALIGLSQTRSRISILNILTNVLRHLTLKYPTSLLPAVYLLSNSLGPSFVAIELGLGSSILSRSIQQISGLSAAALKRLYNTTGDTGDVAYSAKSNIRTLIPHPPLTVPYVFESMLKIARCKGQGAAKEKQKIVEKLLLAASGEEVRYLTRTLCQNLRVGAVRTSILTALARAFVLTPSPSAGAATLDSFQAPPDLLLELKCQASPSKGKNPARAKLTAIFKQAESLMKQVYVKHPSYDQIIPALLENGLDSLAERVPLTVGVPLHPMLGSPTRSLDEIYNRLGNLPFSAEFKYDGQRAQIHASRASHDNHNVKIFSRHLEDMTSKYPDITGLANSIFEDSPEMTSFIMDAEIVAIDPISGVLKSFQDLSGRARKDVNLKDIQIAVCLFAFDLMYLDGESLLERSFRERRNLLHSRFSVRRLQESDAPLAQFDFVKSCESTEGKASIENFMSSAIENRCEGLMIKLLDSPEATGPSTEKQSRLKSLPSTYEPDIRTSGWLKLKKDYLEGMTDSLDLIPVGAWHGNGRKAQWWSPILLALWNPQTGRPVALCKCMSGFTDAFYVTMKEHYSLDTEFCSKRPKWECDFGGYKPDVYFKPHAVWEIRGADITESPVSVAAHGLVSLSRGLSLRFPRFIRTRDDKSMELGSTPSFLADIWRGQQGKVSGAGKDDGDLIDVHGEESDLEYLSNEEDEEL